jgi:hypothetical protein
MESRTVENSPIRSEKAVLETLSVITGFEALLLENNVVNVLACE